MYNEMLTLNNPIACQQRPCCMSTEISSNVKPQVVQYQKKSLKNLTLHLEYLYVAGFPTGLKLFLEDESIQKVGVGITGDMWKLLSDFEVKLKNIVELGDMANERVRQFDTHLRLVSVLFV